MEGEKIGGDEGGVTLVIGKFAVHVRTFLIKKRGQGLVEYLFIVSLIALVAILSLTALGVAVSSFFTSLTNYLSTL